MPKADNIDTDYVVYHMMVNHFDLTQRFGSTDGLKDQVWHWLLFCMDKDKLAMGQVLLGKCVKCPQYLENYKKYGRLDETVLWVMSCILHEPIAVLLKSKLWITTTHLDIGDINILFTYEGEGRYAPIACMSEDEMPDDVPGHYTVKSEVGLVVKIYIK